MSTFVVEISCSTGLRMKKSFITLRQGPTEKKNGCGYQAFLSYCNVNFILLIPSPLPFSKKKSEIKSAKRTQYIYTCELPFTCFLVSRNPGSAPVGSYQKWWWYCGNKKYLITPLVPSSSRRFCFCLFCLCFELCDLISCNLKTPAV